MPKPTLHPRLAQALQKIVGRELDPSRTARVFKEYDTTRGYAAYHDYCRSVFSRRLVKNDSPLEEKGFEYLQVLAPARARSFADQLQSPPALAQIKRDSRDRLRWAVSDVDFVREVFQTILTKPLHDRFTCYFESEFLIHWVTFTLTKCANAQRSVSFRWHCDKGPSRHLKLIVYLNATDDHGGTTEFMDLEQTSIAAQAGYPFGWSRARAGNVQEVSRIVGHELCSESANMAAGQGVIFQPARVLHRGVSPTLGDRCAITLCLLPSPKPWHVAMARGASSDLGTDENWHAHAQQLLDRVNQPEGRDA